MDNVIALDDLFRKRLFHVPDYQRGYSWEEQQVREFLEDLELLSPQRFHYTGTIVLHKADTATSPMDQDGNNYSSVDVVDGQQRLTTIVLLIQGIKSKLNGFSDEAAILSRGIKKNFIATTGTNGQPLYKLSLNLDVDHYFKSSIIADQSGVEGPQLTSELRLETAMETITSHLAAHLDREGDAGEEWLRGLYTKLATQLRFTLYEVENEAEVGVIFEVMNDRGKPLTDLEKVKNFLLHTSIAIGVDNDLAKTVNGAWGEMLRQLMSANLVSGSDEDRLLRAHWLTYYNPQSRQWKGSRSIKEEFDLRKHKERPEDLLDSLHRYTEGLRGSCICFCDAYQPGRPDSFQSFAKKSKTRREIVEWSAKLERIGVVAPFLPLLLAARERWPSDPKRYLEILKLCEAFAFRVYRLAAHRADAGQPALFRLGYDLARGTQSFRGTVDDLKWELAYWCDDQKFKNLTHESDPQVQAAYTWRGLRYFLYEYEISVAESHGSSPLVTWNELRKRDLKDTIEHVLPQSIDDRPYWREGFDQRHQRYVHDLGNLTLTKHNSSYGNKPFPAKKGSVDARGYCYAKSPFYGERELTQWDDWTASTIADRRTTLLEWARTRWSVDLSECEEESYGLVDADEPDEDTDFFEEDDVIED